MTERGGSRVQERWARLRFSIIGALVRFGVSTLERWFSAEQIVLRSGSALGQTIAGRAPLSTPHNNIDYCSALSSAMS